MPHNAIKDYTSSAWTNDANQCTYNLSTLPCHRLLNASCWTAQFFIILYNKYLFNYSSSGVLYKPQKYVLPIQPYKNNELMKDSLVPITGESEVSDVWHPIL